VRLLVCAGGTGGGVYPALSIVQAARDKGMLDDLLWVGGEGGMEAALVAREGIAYEAVPAAGVHGVGIRLLPGNLARLARGQRAAARILKTYRPDVLLFTGGYVAVPVAFAGRRVPIVLYVPDIEPGLALKTVARFADRICLISEDSRRFFDRPERLVVTGHPARQGLADWSLDTARDALGLEQQLPVVLVFGGSKGARSLNRAVLSGLRQLLEAAQVVHLTGTLDWDEVDAQAKLLPDGLRRRYRPYPYLHEEMGAAYRAADLILSRAGASAVGEFPLFGKPAVLVPYPYAWRYQKVNADYLARHGAAVTLPDEQLNDRLLPVLQGLLADRERREAMAGAMRGLAQPDAAIRVAETLQSLTGAGIH